ncbi:MAG: patatin family protein [Fibrobacter sp.]|nr:patatin family protein [Fibrobacter sp.]
MSEIKTGLILEGGAMRGLFTCGILDVLMEHDIEVDGAVGVSAGACFGCNIKSRQPGRALRYNLKYGRDKRYCSFSSLFKTGDLYNADFCYKQIPQVLDPFDYDALVKNPMDFYMVATDAQTGAAAYVKLTDGLGDDLEWMRASASMPLVSNLVDIKGRKYTDGGISDSIPLKYFESIGYNRNIVILTQPRSYEKKKNMLVPLMRLVYRRYPKLVDAVANRHVMYNEETRYVFEQEKLGKVMVLCPEVSLGISRTESDPEKLQRVYDRGRELALLRLDEIKAFLKK